MDVQDLRTLPLRETIETDLCIVGSGPAGLTLVRELAGCGASILVLESGGLETDPWCDALNAITSVGVPRVMDQTLLRNRILGGSSKTWAGRAAAFDRQDFAPRAWVPHSGWPLDREAITPYLPRAMAHLGLGIADNMETPRLWHAVGAPDTPRFDPAYLSDYFWTYSRDGADPRDFMRFGPRAMREQAPGVRCLVNATVTHIGTNPTGSAIGELEVAGRDGQRRTVRARFVVLCAGGIENARLLLASNRIVRPGVGNRHDVVGRYLMDHPRGAIGTFASEDHGRAQRVFNNFRAKIDGRQVTLNYGLALSPQRQRDEQLLNCAVYVYGIPSQDDPWEAMRRLARRRGSAIGDMLKLVRRPVLCAENMKRFLFDRRDPVQRMDSLILQCMVEQQPDPESRVTLDQRTDELGMPLSRIDWRLHDCEARTVRRIGDLFVCEMARLGLPAPTLTPMLTDPGAPFFLPDIAHPTGTTRMADDPKHGVVDANCAVHGVEGLFIAGSSVFPTSGHANPTQMIVTFAVRLADHLRASLKAPSNGSFGIGATAEAASGPEVTASQPRHPLVLVTGASGKTGRKLTAALLGRGYAVRALTSRPVLPSDASSVDWRVHDFRDAGADLRAAVRGCQAVLHLGAELRRAEDMRRVNAEATGELARAVEAEGVRFMAYTSSISVYGSASQAECGEDSPVLSIHADVPSEYWAHAGVRTYGRTKLLGEMALREAARASEYVIFRPTVIVDVADVQDVMRWSAVRRAVFARHRTHHIYVLDVVEALIWAMERSLRREEPLPGVALYNLSDDRADGTFASIFDRARCHGRQKRSWPRLAFPAGVEWLWKSFRFRQPPFSRRPLGLMAFPARKLALDGYSPRYGMHVVRNMAFPADAGGGVSPVNWARPENTYPSIQDS